jgi:calcineurin-like phosphoesterase family protein
MSKIWFTSDTHFSHRNTMRYCGRPFLTVESCDKVMIERWNKLVAPEDTVYHLGDVSMHTAPIKRILPQLNGRKILIIGNHDLVYSPYFLRTRGQKFIDRMYKEYTEAGFAEIHPSGYAKLLYSESMRGYVAARLSHFPTKNAEDKHHNDKHDASRPVDDGTLNICGHVHQNWLKRGSNINVGVDVWDFRPVSVEEVLDLWVNEKELDNPSKLRVALWKAYHTLIWKVKSTLNKDPSKGKK